MFKPHRILSLENCCCLGQSQQRDRPSDCGGSTDHLELMQAGSDSPGLLNLRGLRSHDPQHIPRDFPALASRIELAAFPSVQTLPHRTCEAQGAHLLGWVALVLKALIFRFSPLPVAHTLSPSVSVCKQSENIHHQPCPDYTQHQHSFFHFEKHHSFPSLPTSIIIKL